MMSSSTSLPTPPEWDLLLSAAQKNRSDLIHSMVTQDGVNPSHANGVGQSALHVAALWAHVEAVEALLIVGANVQARNSLTGATPLHMVVTSHKGTFENKLKVVDLLLQHGGAQAATMTDQYGRLPIDYLSTQINNNNNNDGGIVALSAEQEAFVAAITEKLQPVDPPLLVAIDSANVQQVQEQLAVVVVAAAAAAADNDNDTTLQELVNMTFRNETPVTKTVQLLVSAAEKQANAASTTEDSNNMRKLVEILKLILQAGGNPNMSTESAAIAASSSTASGEVIDPPLVQVLQALGQAYRRQQQQQQQQEKEEANSTTTTAATATTTTSIITALQETAVSLRMAGAVLTTNQVGEFLHASARGALGGLSMVQFLLQDLYLNPNATNRQGMTPLQFAARSGRVEIVQYLLLLNNKNNKNNKSLHKNNTTDDSSSGTAGAGVVVVVVNVHHQDHAGQTALDAARKNNKEQVVKILEEYIIHEAAAHEVGDQ